MNLLHEGAAPELGTIVVDDSGRDPEAPHQSFQELDSWLSSHLFHNFYFRLITHKYRGSQQFSRVQYSTQIYRFDTRGAKEYLKVLAAELSIQPHLEINYLQQSDQ